MARVIPDSQILDAALEVIAQCGYAGATTREISAAAGINEVTLFRRFGSKENLLQAAVEQEAARFNLERIDYTGDVEADLVRIVQFYRDLVQSRGRVMATLLNEIPRQPELFAIMRAPFHIFAEIATLIERYQDQGILIREPSTQALIALLGPLFLGSMFEWVQPQVLAVPFDPAEHVRRYLQGRAAHGAK